MRMHVLQHVPFEGPAEIETWATAKGFSITTTRFWLGELPPEPGGIDWLTIMGGPMSVHDESEYPWLAAEKTFVKAFIQSGGPTLGVCLGAQLIAEVLGGGVRKNAQKEIGWFPVSLASSAPPFDAFPAAFSAFHWHGETFDLPPGARHAARSEACENQAFVYGRSVVALQFHLEVTRAAVERMLENCGGELHEAPYIQSREAILANHDGLAAARACLESLLDAMFHGSGLRADH